MRLVAIGLLLATGACAKKMTPGGSTFFDCDRGTRLAANFLDKAAVVRVNDGPAIMLKQVPAASGAAYEGRGYRLHTKGDEAMWNGPTREAPYQCRQVQVPR